MNIFSPVRRALMFVMLTAGAVSASAEVLVFTPDGLNTFGNQTWESTFRGNLSIALTNNGTTANSGELSGPYISFNFDGTNSNVSTIIGGVLRDSNNLIVGLEDDAVVGPNPNPDTPEPTFASSGYFDIGDDSYFSYGSTRSIGFLFEEGAGSYHFGFINLTRASDLGSEYTANFWAYESAANTAITVFSATAVPEPATYACWMAVVGLGFAVWRRRSVARG